MTHTYAVLEVSKKCFDEIEDKLRDAEYFHAFTESEKDVVLTIDMNGIALKIEGTEECAHCGQYPCDCARDT